MATLVALPTAVALPVLPDPPEPPVVAWPAVVLAEPSPLVLVESGELSAAEVPPVGPELPLWALGPLPALDVAPPVLPLLELPELAALLPVVPDPAVGAALTAELPPLPPLAFPEPWLFPPAELPLVDGA